MPNLDAGPQDLGAELLFATEHIHMLCFVQCSLKMEKLTVIVDVHAHHAPGAFESCRPLTLTVAAMPFSYAKGCS